MNVTFGLNDRRIYSVGRRRKRREGEKERGGDRGPCPGLLWFPRMVNPDLFLHKNACFLCVYWLHFVRNRLCNYNIPTAIRGDM